MVGYSIEFDHNDMNSWYWAPMGTQQWLKNTKMVFIQNLLHSNAPLRSWSNRIKSL